MLLLKIGHGRHLKGWRMCGRFTPIYMELIDPFRKLVIYPPLLRTVRAKWNKTLARPDNGTPFHPKYIHVSDRTYPLSRHLRRKELGRC